MHHADAAELHGHRGARGLLPENSLPAFREAIRLGVDCLELDVGMTRDRQIVILHDRLLNTDIVRRDGQWITDRAPIRSMTASELKVLDVGRIKPGSKYAEQFPRQQAIDGVRIPLLSELLAEPKLRTNQNICLNIEIKTAPTARDTTFAPQDIANALLAVVEAARFRSQLKVQSFDWRSLVHLRRTAPDIPLVFLTAQQRWLDNLEVGRPEKSPWLGGIDIDDFSGSAPLAIKHLGGNVWSPYHRDLTAADLKQAHALGLKVIVWTVNKEEDMRQLIAMGVDGIITDYPDLGRRVLGQVMRARN